MLMREPDTRSDERGKTDASHDPPKTAKDPAWSGWLQGKAEQASDEYPQRRAGCGAVWERVEVRGYDLEPDDPSDERAKQRQPSCPSPEHDQDGSAEQAPHSPEHEDPRLDALRVDSKHRPRGPRTNTIKKWLLQNRRSEPTESAHARPPSHKRGGHPKVI